MLCDSRLSEGNLKLQDNVKSIIALVFLVTPHRGSGLTGWGEIASAVAAAALFDVQTSNTQHLDANGEGLNYLEEKFGHLIHRRTFKIPSFQESKGMVGVRPLNAKVTLHCWSRLFP